jgi:sodium/potassium-transporting ATPase subunit alpha
VTSLLSLTALRLRDRQVLIKRTDIIENLGVATIIASDKTGTLTQNRMTVENVWCNLVSNPSTKLVCGRVWVGCWLLG